MRTQMPPPSRWRVRLLCLLTCIGTYWSASGLVRLHEVFAQSESTGSGSGTETLQQGSPTTTPAFDRLVVVLIDALRADMVLGADALGDDRSHREDLSRFMPYTRRLIDEGEALAYVAHAGVPTVTMPRLKALLTGKPPAFIDILKNFNSAALVDDNLMRRFQEAGSRMVFYGDDTWLRLFPSTFQREDGTSGFFTRDTVEVDDNVTRHLRDELDPMMRDPKSQDWDVLVLHYLGLDHVGHLRGPRSALMQDKMQEMDAVIRQVIESVRAQDQRRQRDTNASTLVVLCSDHGMSEVGNHGGASVEESSALLAFVHGNQRVFSSKSGREFDPHSRRQQVDLVPTIAALFGLPIPVHSTGLLLDEVVRICSTETNALCELEAWLLNYVQLKTLARLKLPKSQAEELLHSLSDVEAAVETRLTSRVTDLSVKAEDTILLDEIRRAADLLRSRVTEIDGSEYDEASIVVGVAVTFVTVVASMFDIFHRSRRQASGLDMVVLITGVMQIVALTSSSSIENEHATVFTSVNTILFGVMLDSIRRKYPSKSKALALVTFLIVCNRLLRSRNQIINFGRLNMLDVDPNANGNEFANDNSISILSTAPLVPQLSPPVAVAVIGVVKLLDVWHSGTRFCRREDGLIVIMFAVGVTFAVICAAMGYASVVAVQALGGIISLDTAARSVYACVGALVMLGLATGRRQLLASIELSLWLLVLLVQRDSNMPTLLVLCLQLAFFPMLVRLLRAGGLSSAALGILTWWLSLAAFFALGNSHLVTTVDISQSYHGLDGYNQGIVGFLTFVNVLSGPLLCLISFAKVLTTMNTNVAEESDAVVAPALLFYQATRMMVYTVVVYFMRFHLFIWSVFAPKFLYEVVNTVVVCSFAFLVTL
ncbi:hypothetical protein PINS_up004036 [Pythium insidiosum]|nr:hypothetical protein PINS_up004036 [Pythium insidiosum]